MIRKTYLIGFLLVVCIIGSFLLFRQSLFSARKVHFHAGFIVFVDGVKQEYSDVKYMDLEPCTQNNLNANEQEAKAHLHEGIGDVVHVHRNGSTWQDLFTNIHMVFDKKKAVTGYINGASVAHILTQPIHPYDSVVIIVGTGGSISDFMKNAVTVEHIKAIEKTSELCGS